MTSLPALPVLYQFTMERLKSVQIARAMSWGKSIYSQRVITGRNQTLTVGFSRM